MNIFKWAIGAVFACGIAYAGLLGTKAEVKEIKEDVKEHDRAIVSIKTDLGYIKDGIDELRGRRRRDH